jgi:cytochrome c oxidase cbb3-type subunit 3
MMRWKHAFGAAWPLAALLGASGCTSKPASLARDARQQPGPPSIRYEQHILIAGAVPGGGSLSNPLAEDKEAAANGEKLFLAMNCDGCHGVGAVGAEGPSLADGRWRYGGADGAVFQSIYYGRPRGMPAYGGILPANSIWKIISYLRAQPRPADIPTESWP